MYLEQLKTLVMDSSCFSSTDFIGCSNEEIQQIEKQLGKPLPEAYKEFLHWIGKNGGPILRGSDCFYADLSNLRKWANELLNENALAGMLPENAFVFFMHQGYQFAFMYLSDDQNPPIYYFNEMDYSPVEMFKISYYKFTDFLADEIKNTILFLGKYQIDLH